MKHNFSKKIQLCIACWILLLPFSGTAQKIVYEYDNAGNRISRTVVLPKAPQRAQEELTDTTFYKEAIGNKEITLYPNPVKSDLHVSISGYEEGSTGECMLFDMQGKVLLKRRIDTSTFQVDMSSYKSGNYIMRIVIDGEPITWKIIKQ